MNYEAQSIPIRYVLNVWVLQRYIYWFNLSSLKDRIVKGKIYDTTDVFDLSKASSYNIK